MRLGASASVVLLTLGVIGRASQDDPVDQIVRTQLTAQRIPGVAVAVVRRGEVVKSQGYGLRTSSTTCR